MKAAINAVCDLAALAALTLTAIIFGGILAFEEWYYNEDEQS